MTRNRRKGRRTGGEGQTTMTTAEDETAADTRAGNRADAYDEGTRQLNEEIQDRSDRGGIRVPDDAVPAIRKMLADAEVYWRETAALREEYGLLLSNEAQDAFQRERSHDFLRVESALLHEGVIADPPENGFVRTWTKYSDPHKAAAELLRREREAGVPENLRALAADRTSLSDALEDSAASMLRLHGFESVGNSWRMKRGWRVEVLTPQGVALRDAEMMRAPEVIPGVLVDSVVGAQSEADALLMAAASMYGGTLMTNKHKGDLGEVAASCLDRAFAMRAQIRLRLDAENEKTEPQS